MRLNTAIITLALLFTLTPASYAKTVTDPGHDAAIKGAQTTLKDPKQIHEITDSDPKAKDLDNSIKDLTGSEESTKELYSISADILPVLMEMNQDNPEKALESLASYSKDPEAFMKQLPANLRLKIENLASKIEKSKVKKKP